MTIGTFAALVACVFGSRALLAFVRGVQRPAHGFAAALVIIETSAIATVVGHSALVVTMRFIEQ